MREQNARQRTRSQHGAQRGWAKRFTAGAAIAALLLGGAAVAAALPSQAATHGAGYNNGNGWIGQEMVGQVATFCLQINRTPPTGNTTFTGNQQYPAMSSDDNARVNFAVSQYGQLASNNWASAVHLYVWSLADTAVYNSHGMSGDSYYVARAPRSQKADILGKLSQIRNEAASITAGSTGNGTGDLDLDVDANNNYNGAVTVRNLDPSDATGVLTLTNGVFTSNGTNTISGAVNNASFDIRGVNNTGNSTYKIGASGDFTGSGSGYAGQIGLYQTAGQQNPASVTSDTGDYTTPVRTTGDTTAAESVNLPAHPPRGTRCRS